MIRNVHVFYSAPQKLNDLGRRGKCFIFRSFFPSSMVSIYIYICVYMHTHIHKHINTYCFCPALKNVLPLVHEATFTTSWRENILIWNQIFGLLNARCNYIHLNALTPGKETILRGKKIIFKGVFMSILGERKSGGDFGLNITICFFLKNISEIFYATAQIL